MWPPAARWSEHLFMLVVRDTRGWALEERERLNRFPANPYCCITWMLEGRIQLLSQGDRHSFCAVFYPDAFHALFGVDLAAIQDGFVDATQVLPDHGLRLVQVVAEARDDDERRRLVDQFMAAHAESLRTSAWMRLRRMGANIGLQLASRMLGVGQRQVQRLARREGGMNVPGLSRLWRECKQISGRTPTQIVRQAPHDEADWMYRL